MGESGGSTSGKLGVFLQPLQTGRGAAPGSDILLGEVISSGLTRLGAPCLPLWLCPSPGLCGSHLTVGSWPRRCPSPALPFSSLQWGQGSAPALLTFWGSVILSSGDRMEGERLSPPSCQSIRWSKVGPGGGGRVKRRLLAFLRRERWEGTAGDCVLPYRKVTICK